MGIHENIVENGDSKQCQKAKYRKYQAEGLVLVVFLKIILSPVLFNTSINDFSIKIGSMSLKFTCDIKLRGLNDWQSNRTGMKFAGKQ